MWGNIRARIPLDLHHLAIAYKEGIINSQSQFFVAFAWKLNDYFVNLFSLYTFVACIIELIKVRAYQSKYEDILPALRPLPYPQLEDLMCDFFALLTPSIYVAIICQHRILMSHLQLGSNGLQTWQVESRQNALIVIMFERDCKHDIPKNPLDMKRMFERERITDFYPNFILI